ANRDDNDREPANPAAPGHRPLGRAVDGGQPAAAGNHALGRAPQGGGRRRGRRGPPLRRRGMHALPSERRGVRLLAARGRPVRHARPSGDAYPALQDPVRTSAELL
ncbi:MAG: FIG00635924: hypothetical protein, partial [uncultured Sphingomonadaceae bacterium]